MAPDAGLQLRRHMVCELRPAGTSFDGVVPMCLKGREFFLIGSDGAQAAVLAREEQWPTELEFEKGLSTVLDDIGNIAVVIKNSGQAFFEFKLSRPLLFSGKNGGLRAVAPDEKEFSTFQTHGDD